jgi:hypothetical protein
VYSHEVRRLTNDEVDQEVRDIETRTWPHDNSVLPMKNLYDGRRGLIFRTHERGIVAEVVFTDSRQVTYPSLKAMVESGWVVD